LIAGVSSHLVDIVGYIVVMKEKKLIEE
jgi:hypothetical protein